ncbi:MAG: uridine diphosphate-N-acetylglucosamine-binding protein YvcK [Acidobacteriota bacterium]|nr:YvcK family protein [Thermoanaerobaculaceae bacterium]
MSFGDSSLKNTLGKVVAIGGGTGLPALLEALRPVRGEANFEKLSAIVTVSDTGGSSGRLRRDLGTLAPGDIRNCLVALSDAPELLRKLFQYRFSTGELEGHSFGNLFIVALAEVMGDFSTAIEKLHDILAIKGQIFPSTRENVELVARFDDGSVIKGEELITQKRGRIVEISLEPKNCSPPQGAIEVLSEADLILLGPGSLFTSVIPNILVPKIKETIIKSKARKIYICNLVTQPGETDNFSASDHIKEIFKISSNEIVDTILVNTEKISEKVLKNYLEKGSAPVKIDEDELYSLNLAVVKKDLVLEGEFLRHDPIKLRKTIFELMKTTVEKI